MKKSVRNVSKILLLIIQLLVLIVLCVGCGENDKDGIAAPSGLSLDNMVLCWDKVDGVTEYEISVDGVNYIKVDETEIKLDNVITSTETSKIYVRAVGGKIAEFPVVVSKLKTPNKPRIEIDPDTKNERFVWDKVTDAKKYLIKVNDGKWIVNSSNHFSTTVSGKYKLSVKCKSYSEDNYIYLESDPSETSEELDLLVGATLMEDTLHTLSWDIEGFDSFNLWVDNVCVRENVMPGVFDNELGGWTGFNFVDEGVITKTGEYDIQLECKKGDKTAWSNTLVEVGTALINENEICSFDNRRLVVNNVDAAALTDISTDIKHGEKGASLRIERAVQVNLNLDGQYVEQLNMHTLEEISYWVYLEKPEGSTEDEAQVGYIPTLLYDAWDLGVSSQRFNPKNISSDTVPWNTWIEVKSTVNSRYPTTLIIRYGGPGVVYIDDIYYTTLIEEPENAKENGLTSDNAIRFVKGHFAASYQCTTINLGEEFGGRDDVLITMDIYLHTNSAQPFGLTLYSWQDGQLNTDEGNLKGLPIGYVHYQTPSDKLNIGEWNTITFKACKINENGDFKFSPGCYADETLGFTDNQATYWIYVKNVRATVFDVEKKSDTELTVNSSSNLDSIELYINDVKVKDDITNDIVSGVYNLVNAGYISTSGDYCCSVKLVAVKDGIPVFTTSKFIFEHLTEGVQVALNPNGVEAWAENKDDCRAIVISIDNSKFDGSEETTEWVNVTMDIKGTIGKNSQGESATGGMYIRAYDWGVANGKIDGDLPIFSGASSWFDAYTKADWTTIMIRAPKKATTGGIYLVPFSWPTGFSITVFAKNIVVDYDTITSSSANPIQTAYNANGAQHKNTSNAVGCSAITVLLDTSKFDNDDSTIEYVSVSMKLKGSIEGNLSEGAGGYLDVSTWAVGNGYVASDNYIYSGDTKNIIEILSSSTWKEVTLRLPVKYNYGSVCFSAFIYPGYNVNTLQARDIVVDYSTVSSSFSLS